MAMLLRPDDLRVERGQTASMHRAVAIDRAAVGSAGLYSAVTTTRPGGRTRAHHHGPCETSIYVIRGRARFTFGPSGVEEAFEAGPGDVVYIPAGEVHVEENASQTDELVVLVTRNCAESVVHYAD